MSQTIATRQKQCARAEAAEELRRLRAEFAEATTDLTEDEYEALVEDLTRRVNDGLRAHVRKSRGESV